MTTIERVDPTLATDLGLSPIDAWMADAGCRDLDTTLFFSDELDDIADAKRACLACPVRARCLDAPGAPRAPVRGRGGPPIVAGRRGPGHRGPPRAPGASSTASGADTSSSQAASSCRSAGAGVRPRPPAPATRSPRSRCPTPIDPWSRPASERSVVSNARRPDR